MPQGLQRIKFMKHHKINFFESPNPRHINFHNFNEYRLYPSDESESHQEVLLSTPKKIHKTPTCNPSMLHFQEYCICPLMDQQRKAEEDSSRQLSHQQESNHQQPLSYQGIAQKVSFSQNQEQEELMIPFTPLKNQHKRQTDQVQDTVKKQPNICYTPATLLTPGSENRSNQRGLKKLAAQAYRFVLHQKRTSYKEVAKKLIEQLGDESELDVTKRGQMNIKRRVYDALNVLIALGLLRRNGNKIMSKRDQMQFVSQDLSYSRQRQRRREIVMQEELASLRQAIQKKQELMNRKRRMQLDIKQKMDIIKEVTDKNKNAREKIATQDNKLQFPIMVLCFNRSLEQNCTKKQQNHSKNGQEMQDEKQQQMLKIWQNNANNVSFSFNKQNNVELLGEFDVLGVWRNEEKKEKALKIQKIKKRR